MACDPGVVAGWDVHDLVGPDLGFLAGIHPNAEAPAQDQLQRVDLSGGRADEGLHILGPPPARLQDGSSDDQPAAEVDEAAAATPERADRVGGVDVPQGEL